MAMASHHGGAYGRRDVVPPAAAVQPIGNVVGGTYNAAGHGPMRANAAFRGSARYRPYGYAPLGRPAAARGGLCQRQPAPAQQRGPIELFVAELSSNECTLSWTSRLPHDVFDEYILSLDVPLGRSDYYYMEKYHEGYKILALTPGQKYTVNLKAVHHWYGNQETVEASTIVPMKARGFSLSEMLKLLVKAEVIAASCGEMRPFDRFYRTKKADYWNTILTQYGGVEPAYEKDGNGHKASPINQHVPGIFFTPMTDPYWDRSPFGDKAYHFPASMLLNPSTDNAYFADVYCMSAKQIHYVTIVVCRKSSKWDEWCKGNLVPLDIMAPNNFICYDTTSDTFWARHSPDKIWIEVFYNGPVDIRMGTPMKMNEEKRGAIGHNPLCDRCNLIDIVDVDGDGSSSSIRYLHRDGEQVEEIGV